MKTKQQSIDDYKNHIIVLTNLVSKYYELLITYEGSVYGDDLYIESDIQSIIDTINNEIKKLTEEIENECI